MNKSELCKPVPEVSAVCAWLWLRSTTGFSVLTYKANNRAAEQRWGSTAEHSRHSAIMLYALIISCSGSLSLLLLCCCKWVPRCCQLCCCCCWWLLGTYLGAMYVVCNALHYTPTTYYILRTKTCFSIRPPSNANSRWMPRWNIQIDKHDRQVSLIR